MLRVNKIHKFLSPVFLTFSMWSLALLLSSIFSSGIEINIWIIIIIYLIVFSLGASFSNIIHVNKKFKSYRVNHYFFYLFFYFFCLVNFSYFIQILVGISKYGLNFFFLYRVSVIDGDVIIPFYNIYIGILQITFGLGLYILVRESIYHPDYKLNRKVFYLTIITLILTLADGSRSFFMMSFISFFIFLIHFSKIKISTAIYTLFIVTLLFIFSFGILRGTEKGFIVGLNYLVVYISGGIKAFNYVVNDNLNVFWWDLASISNKIYSLGLIDTYSDLSDAKLEFVTFNDNYQTNVFTALGVYYSYFGYAMYFYVFAFAFFSNYLYRNFLKKISPISVFLFLIFINASIFSVFHDYSINLIYYLFKVLVVFTLIYMVSFLFSKMKFLI